MFSTRRNIFRAVALFTAVCVAHVCVFAATPDPAAIVQQTGGTLSTTNNQPVTVNGNSVKPGTTVLTGSTVETPAGIGATIELGFAELQISPGTELVLDFTPGASVKVTLRHGCVSLRVQGDAQGTIITPAGTSVPTGDKKFAQVCDDHGGGTPVVNPGPAVGASGINKTVLALLLVGTSSVVVALILRGRNPSPSNP
ncbi:MAG TPA: hypothetical protein VFA21_11080 [Pyrinomonadaceae bacterium]|nr:hypothetical protein [Pyrinomonadaceae bacterium]